MVAPTSTPSVPSPITCSREIGYVLDAAQELQALQDAVLLAELPLDMMVRFACPTANTDNSEYSDSDFAERTTFVLCVICVV